MEGRVRLRAVGGGRSATEPLDREVGCGAVGGEGAATGQWGGVALVGGLVLVPGDFGDAGEEVEVAGEDEEIVGEAVYVADEFGIYVCFFG